MNVQKIHHVSVLVRDLEKAGKLYSELFGIEFDGPYEQEALDVKYLSSSLGLNLAAPLTPDGPSAKTLERRGEGLSMLVLNVPDIEEAIDDTESRGVRLVGREDRPTSRVASFHPKDLCGVMIELMEE
jgi:methylmalonyl-CoA epimerase